MNHTPFRFILYARKSGEREDRQIKSLPDQLSILRELAKREGLRVIDEVLESKSAKTPDNRPLFTEMIQRVEDGEADGILVWHINRLVRNKKEAGHVEWLLESGKIQCIRTPERTHLPKDNSVILSVETAVATQFSRDLADVVSRAVEEKAKRGWWPHRAKLGYIVNPETHDVEPDPELFPLLRLGWELMLTGAYTVPHALDELTQQGLRIKANRKRGEDGPRPKRPLSRSVLYRILRDPFYMGHFKYRGSLQVGKHDPMVTPGEFETVQRYLSKGQQVQPQKREFPFTGLIRCGTCGCMVTAEEKIKRYPMTGTTRSYTYYHCTGRKGCQRLSVTEDFIQGKILDIAKRVTIDSRLSEWAVGALERDKTDNPPPASAFSQTRQRELEQAQTRLNTLFEMREQGEIGGNEFVDRKARLNALINELTVSVLSDASRHRTAVAGAQRILTMLPKAVELLEKGTPLEKRTVAKLLCDSYVLTLDETGLNLELKLDPVVAEISKFELQNRRPQQVGTDGLEFDNPSWRTVVTSIRTLIAEETNARAHQKP